MATGSYSLLYLHTRSSPGVPTEDLWGSAGSIPRHQFQARSQLDLTSRLALDVAAMYGGSLHIESSGLAAARVPGNLRADLRMGWRVTPNLEISGGVQGALSPRHLEFISTLFPQPLEVRRNVWRAVIGCILSAALLCGAALGADVRPEYEVRAAYV
jgi:hypothetical protein